MMYLYDSCDDDDVRTKNLQWRQDKKLATILEEEDDDSRPLAAPYQ